MEPLPPQVRGKDEVRIEKRKSCLQNPYKTRKETLLWINKRIAKQHQRPSCVWTLGSGNGIMRIVMQLSQALLRNPEAGTKKTDY